MIHSQKTDCTTNDTPNALILLLKVPLTVMLESSPSFPRYMWKSRGSSLIQNLAKTARENFKIFIWRKWGDYLFGYRWGSWQAPSIRILREMKSGLSGVKNEIVELFSWCLSTWKLLFYWSETKWNSRIINYLKTF